jgi:hypothetical protein
MRIHRPALMTALALVVLLAAACAAGVGASTLPLGAYVNDKTPMGRDVLTLANGGQYTENVGTEWHFTGTWKVTGDQIELTQTSGAADCNVLGVYKWALNGKALSLTAVQDPCVPRLGNYTSGAFTRQP